MIFAVLQAESDLNSFIFCTGLLLVPKSRLWGNQCSTVFFFFVSREWPSAVL